MKSTSFSLLLVAASASSALAKGQAGHRVKRQFGNHGVDHIAKRDLALASALTVNNGTSKLANSTRPVVAAVTNSTAAVNATSEPSVFTSTAVYTHFDGGESACLQYNKDEDLIFGVSEHFWNITYTNYGASPIYCGIQVAVTNTETKKTVLATVQENSGQMDWVLCSVGLFTALGGDLNIGELPVSFSFPRGTNGQVGLGALGGNSTVSSAQGSSGSTSGVRAAAASPVPTDGSASATKTQSPPTSQAATATEMPKPTTSSVDYEAIESSKQQALAAAQSSKADEARYDASVASSKAAAASRKASADAAWASSKSQADAAAASSKASADAAWAASSRSKEAAAEAKPTQASDNDNGGGGGQVYHGDITFYYQRGVAGACGNVAQESDKVIALYTSMYDNGKNCGRKVLITNKRTGKQETGVVADECPTCTTPESIDLSVGLFFELSTEAIGMEEVSWKFIS